MYQQILKLDPKEWKNLAEHALLRANQTQASVKYQHALKRVYWRDKVEIFTEAAEAFRISGRYINSSDSYSQAASILEYQLESNYAAALLYTEAGLCLEKLEPSKGSDSLGENFENILVLLLRFNYFTILFLKINRKSSFIVLRDRKI